MEELENIKPSEKKVLKIRGKEREVRFPMSAWANIMEEFGGMENLDSLKTELKKNPFKMLPKLAWFGIADKEGIEDLTMETILDEFGFEDIQNISRVITSALWGSMPKVKGDKKKLTVEKK